MNSLGRFLGLSFFFFSNFALLFVVFLLWRLFLTFVEKKKIMHGIPEEHHWQGGVMNFFTLTVQGRLLLLLDLHTLVVFSRNGGRSFFDGMHIFLLSICSFPFPLCSSSCCSSCVLGFQPRPG